MNYCFKNINSCYEYDHIILFSFEVKFFKSPQKYEQCIFAGTYELEVEFITRGNNGVCDLNPIFNLTLKKEHSEEVLNRLTLLKLKSKANNLKVIQIT